MATAASTARTNRIAVRRSHRVARPLLAAHVRRYWPALLVGSLLAVLQVITKLAEPWPLGWLVDNALTGAPQGAADIRSDLVIAVGSLALIVATGAVFDYWSTPALLSRSPRQCTSPGDAVLTLDDFTAEGSLQCWVTRGTKTDLIRWAAHTDVAWERRNS